MVFTMFGDAETNPTHVAKSSRDTWIDPEHVPVSVCATSVAAFMSSENTIVITLSTATPLAALSGSVDTTSVAEADTHFPSTHSSEASQSESSKQSNSHAPSPSQN